MISGSVALGHLPQARYLQAPTRNMALQERCPHPYTICVDGLWMVKQ
jgi:hypothetical protein